MGEHVWSSDRGRLQSATGAPNPIRPLLIATYLPPAALLAGVIAIGKWKEIDDVMLRSDPATATGAPFYTGFLSYIGIVVWCIAAVLCLYTWLLLRDVPVQHRRISPFLLGAGGISAWMLFDDLFMLHEDFFPRVVGIGEAFVMVAYAAIVLLFFCANYRAILQTDYRLVLSRDSC